MPTALSTAMAAAASNRTLMGILCMLLASTLLPVMNGLVQILSERYTTEQILWARASSHLVFILALFAPRYGPAALVRSAAPGWQILRSGVHLMSMLCFFTGVKYLPLAKAASISFAAPFIVAVLAWPLLGERMTVGRIGAVAVAFLGVLVVIRPGSEVFQWAALLLLGSAFFYALYQILTRRVSRTDSAETSTLYSPLLATAAMSLVLPFAWVPVASWGDAALLGSLGILGGTAHYFVARAMIYAQANIIAPFGYWQLVASVAVGYLISGYLPDALTWIGAGIIVCAGVWIAWTETRKQPAVRP
ncbi:MAG: DMT family transporter [Hyphomicrobiaceae bacterium]